MLFLAEATWHLAQALGVEADVRTHTLQGTGIAKTILIDRLVYHRHAVCLREQNHKGLLPIGHEARMDISLQCNGRRKRALADKADTVIIYFKAQAHLRERVQEGEQ